MVLRVMRGVLFLVLSLKLPHKVVDRPFGGNREIGLVEFFDGFLDLVDGGLDLGD